MTTAEHPTEHRQQLQFDCAVERAQGDRIGEPKQPGANQAQPQKHQNTTRKKQKFPFLLLIACTAAGLIGKAAHFPAVWLIGPLFVAALFAVKGWGRLQLPRNGIFFIQSMIGVSLSGSFTLSSLVVLTHNWLPVLLVVLSMQFLTIINALFFVRFCGLNPATAILGTLPGGAGEMAAMSPSFGADSRLVSVMQYTRLLIIILFLSIGTSFIVHGAAATHLAHAGVVHQTASTAIAPGAFSIQATLLAVLASLAGGFLAMRLRIPAGTLLLPLAFSLGANMFGLSVSYPPVVLAAVYACLGMQIGSQFEKEVLTRIKGLMLPLVGTSCFLAAGSIALGIAFARITGLDGASAYLASTPGGLDSVAVVANEIKADSAIVICVHFSRLMLVLLSGPQLVPVFNKLLGVRSAD